MKTIVVFILTFFTLAIEASPLKIATGEYAPYSGEHIEHQGISSQVVRAVFREIKQDIILQFMPWKRVMSNIDNETVAGSFPWNMNDERLHHNYFSRPIHLYRVFAFTKKGQDFNTEDSLRGKIICLPSGWDQAPYLKMIDKLKLQVESPMSIESCFSMLAIKRVDIIFMNELVGKEVERKIFGRQNLIVASEKSYFQKRINLYYMISKEYPNAKKIITSFNLGLEKIKGNGVYESIVEARSTCGICNRLGSL